jgi:8-oxo-dGTP pyrophosphatase MutT (NUDIX family)
MPDKAYAIIHDGKTLLVAGGGKSGATPAQRRGSHFPGGTVPQKTPPWQQVNTEITEETGLPVSVTSKTPSFTILKPPKTVLHFLVVHVDSVDALVQQFQRPKVLDAYDEPFESVLAVPIEDALAPGFFNGQDYTDWFGDGLKQARALNLLS